MGSGACWYYYRIIALALCDLGLELQLLHSRLDRIDLMKRRLLRIIDPE